ncbi:MAG: hypothetical protein LQ347_001079 [Umbilicaria vellea]|nr:MAG: hypothetical protein LQ347_001079 [Umbilicaria vellea]
MFQPTTSFQTVHDDQELPVGLHIRLNLETGQKEARLNVPMPDEVEVGSGLVIIDDKQPSVDGIADKFHHDQSVLKQSVADHGPIRPPSPGSSEGTLFAASISSLTSAPPLDPAGLIITLETLEDLSHDLYWGVSLANDGAAVHRLIDIFDGGSEDPATRGLAALVLGTALQNNPAALSALMSHYDGGVSNAIPIDQVLMALTLEKQPQVLARLVFLLSAMCQDPAQIARFEGQEGLSILLKAYDADHVESGTKDKLRGKIANFLVDHFVFESHVESSTTEDSIIAGHENEVVAPILDSPGPVSSKHSLGKVDSGFGRASSAEHWNPWVIAFRKSLEEWKSTSNGHEMTDPIRSIQDAYVKLEKSWVS